tara:strand:- start:74 stop:421 length:348 start_codon:yes stop_codon:yes gene_type:complete
MEIKKRIKPLKSHITNLVNQKISNSRKKSESWNETIIGLSVAIIDAPKDWPITPGDVIGGIKVVRKSVRSDQRVKTQLRILSSYGLLTKEGGLKAGNTYYLNFELPGELLGTQEA